MTDKNISLANVLTEKFCQGGIASATSASFNGKFLPSQALQRAGISNFLWGAAMVSDWAVAGSKSELALKAHDNDAAFSLFVTNLQATSGAIAADKVALIDASSTSPAARAKAYFAEFCQAGGNPAVAQDILLKALLSLGA